VNIRFLPLDQPGIDRTLELVARLYRHDSIPFDGPRVRRAIEQLLANPQWGGIWWIEANEELAGYFVLTVGYSLEFGGRFALLDEFLVDDAWQGQGIGTQVLAFIESWSRSEGIEAIRLEVAQDNPRALALYRRSGFVTHDRHFMTRLL
jgi:GNAT superfamily N-acetyltransferase